RGPLVRVGAPSGPAGTDTPAAPNVAVPQVVDSACPDLGANSCRGGFATGCWRVSGLLGKRRTKAGSGSRPPGPGASPNRPTESPPPNPRWSSSCAPGPDPPSPRRGYDGRSSV